jgi:ribosomal protein S18 acetylase RimI-like enzyme
MEILIRPWQREDFPAVRRILRESWNATYSAFIPEEDLRSYFETTYQIDSLTRLYECRFVHGAIGEADGEAVGFARTQFHANENRLYLASLYLLPTHQGRGIGGKLLGVAEEKALAYDLRELWVGVMVQNEAARRWYDRRGFRFVKEEPFRMGGTTVPHLIGFKAITKQHENAELQRRCFASFDGEGETLRFADLAADLLEHQKKSWPKLGEGYAALAAVRVRKVGGDRSRIYAQLNAQRLLSSAAPVDPESIRKRPCFLCLENLPSQQQGILYRKNDFILCNPAPIFPVHYTIAHLRHLPQAISDHFGTFLRLAEDFGPRMTLIYNGPRCGASAPDHLHFQAFPAGLLPVEKEILERTNLVAARRRNGVAFSRAAGLGRGMVILEGEDMAAVAAAFGDAIRALGRLAGGAKEPMLNLLGAHTGRLWRLILFPRRRHRPDAYFQEGEGKLLVSPGAVDMGGIFITPREEDFHALDPGLVERIFREVAFTDAEVDALLDLL